MSNQRRVRFEHCTLLHRFSPIHLKSSQFPVSKTALYLTTRPQCRSLTRRSPFSPHLSLAPMLSPKPHKRCPPTKTLQSSLVTKMGAATFIDGYSSTLVVYQAADTSVRMLRGYDPPLNTFSYSNALLLAANVARNDTPLAITVEHDAAEYGLGHRTTW